MGVNMTKSVVNSKIALKIWKFTGFLQRRETAQKHAAKLTSNVENR